jgi:hypothetical protein
MPGNSRRAQRVAEVRAWLQATQRRRAEAFVRSQQERKQARDRLARETGLHEVELHSVAEEMNVHWQTR